MHWHYWMRSEVSWTMTWLFSPELLYRWIKLFKLLIELNCTESTVNWIYLIMTVYYCPSIHPSSSAYPGPGRGGSSLSRDTQTSLSLVTSSSSSGGHRGVPRPAGRHSPRSSPGPPPGGTRPKHLPGKASRRHPEQMPEPPQLTPLDVEEQRLYSELLPSDWASHPISKGAPSHPTEKAHFGRLYPHSWTRPPDTWTPPLEVATLHQPVVDKPPFSDWGPWPRIWRRWFSSQPLHTRLQTVPVNAEGPGLRWPTRQHHPQRAETKSRGPQTQHPPAPGCA